MIRRLVFCFSNKSRKQWSQDHNRDPYVRMSRYDNYRSRAAYKIIEAQEKLKIVNKEATVLDLGAAPGSWSQALIKFGCKVVAIDLLKIYQIQGVDIFKGDATDRNIMQPILNKYGLFDTIVSDMAPNFTGDSTETHEEIINLNKVCLSICGSSLKQGGSLLMKTLYGPMYKPLFSFLSVAFSSTLRLKPKASRSSSSELYHVATGFNRQTMEELLTKMRAVQITEADTKDTLIAKLKK